VKDFAQAASSAPSESGTGIRTAGMARRQVPYSSFSPGVDVAEAHALSTATVSISLQLLVSTIQDTFTRPVLASQCAVAVRENPDLVSGRKRNDGQDSQTKRKKDKKGRSSVLKNEARRFYSLRLTAYLEG
jgi:hypothetical protein